MNKIRNNHEQLARFFAPFMFVLSLLFLVLTATLIVLWVDVPRFELVAGDFQQVTEDGVAYVVEGSGDSAIDYVEAFVLYGLAAIWAIIVVEVLMQLFLSRHTFSVRDLNKWRWFAVLQCLCPPLRLAAPNVAHSGDIWLPWARWQQPGRKLYRKLELAMSKPMLFFALMILPLMLVEFAFHDALEQLRWLRITIHLCTGLIWCAFAVEFIVLVSASEKRLAYVKRNWIDLVIILLPIVMFLRSLRALRLARVIRFAKVQQLVRISRIYRMRALAIKVVRALMLLEVFARLVGVTNEKRLERMQAAYAEKQEELDELAMEIKRLESEIASADAVEDKTAA